MRGSCVKLPNEDPAAWNQNDDLCVEPATRPNGIVLPIRMWSARDFQNRTNGVHSSCQPLAQHNSMSLSDAFATTALEQSATKEAMPNNQEELNEQWSRSDNSALATCEEK